MKLHLSLGLLTLLSPLCRAADEAPYSLAILPDIQYYYNNYEPGNYQKLLAQISWIYNHAESDNIAATLQLGDITQNDNNDHQWTGARGAFDALNGKVPYVLAVGNHDGDDNGRVSYFTKPEYFGEGSPYYTQPTVGGSMTPGDLANSYHFIDTGDRTWMVVTLEWAPRDAVMTWLDQVLTEHPAYRTIIITHAYFFRDNARYDSQLLAHEYPDNSQGSPKDYPIIAADPEGANDGQDMWRKVIKQHPQVALVYSGHVGSNGVGRRMSIGPERQVVRERLTDFQGWTGSGNGWMQTVNLSADGNLAAVETFSPYLDEEIFDPDLNYQFPFFESVLPASRREALEEAAPAYHFDLYGHSALRPVPNDGTLDDGLFLVSRIEAGLSHEIRDGQVIKGQVATPSAEWALSTWLRFDASMLGSDAAVEALQLGPLQVFAAPSSDGSRLELRANGETLATDRAELLANRWYYLSVSQDADQIHFYVDGELTGEADAQVAFEPISILKLGSVQFSGQIHDASLYQRALSMRELQRVRLAAFTEVQAGQITLGALNPGDAMGVPGISQNMDDTGRLNVRRTERSYLRYGGGGVYENVSWMDDPLQYSDGVLLATVRGGQDATKLASVGIDRAYYDAFSGFHHGLRSGLSFEVQYTGSRAFVGLNTSISYAYFPFASGFVAGHVGKDGVLIEENGLATDAAAPLGTGGVVRLSSPAVDANAGLIFANIGNTDPAIVSVGYHTSGEADFFPQTTYMDYMSQSELQPFSFVYLPADTPGLTGGIYDGSAAQSLRSYESATITREGTGTYLIELEDVADAATLLLNSIVPDSDGTYTEAADNHLVYEPLGEGRYRVYCYDMPGNTLEDGSFAWALVLDEDAFQPAAEPLPEADQKLIAYVPGADYVAAPWHYSNYWGWIYAGYWPWVNVQGRGWVWFEPTQAPGTSWAYHQESAAWYYICPEYWPWMYTEATGWTYYLPPQ